MEIFSDIGLVKLNCSEQTSVLRGTIPVFYCSDCFHLQASASYLFVYAGVLCFIIVYNNLRLYGLLVSRIQMPNLTLSTKDINNSTFRPLIAVAVMVVVVNSLLIISFLRSNVLRKNPANWLILSIAVADLLVGLVYVPCFIEMQTNDGLRKASPYITSFYAFLALANMISITYDRHVAIFQGLHYERKIRGPFVHRMIASTWIIPVIVSSIPLTWINAENNMKILLDRYCRGVMAVCTLIFSTGVAVVYVRIFRIQRRFTKLSKDAELNLMRQLRSARVFGTVWIMHGICWFPVFFINICDSLSVTGEAVYIPSWFVNVSLYFFIINSLANPLIYGLIRRDFRKALIHCLRGICGGGVRRSSVDTLMTP